MYCLGWLAIRLSADFLAEKYFFAREREFGREWKCKEKRAGGILLSLTYSCSGASLAVAGPAPIKADLESLQIGYVLFRPLTVGLKAQSPLKVVMSESPSQTSANWRSLALTASFGPFRARAVRLSGDDIEVRIVDQGPEQAILLRSVVATIDLVSDQRTSSEMAHVDLVADGLSATVLDRAFDDGRPANLAATFSLSHAEALMRGPPRGRLDAWRTNQGALNLANLRLTRGRLAVEAQAELSIDAMRRLSGQIRGQAAGLSELLLVLGLPGSSGKGGGIMGGLFRKQAKEATAEPELPRRMTPFTFSLKDGALWLGPIRTPVALRPLF